MAEAFEEKLHSIRTEKAVNLGFGSLCLEEAKAVAEAIQGNPLLTHLAIHTTHFGSIENVEAFAAGLVGSSVVSLGLRSTYFGDAGVAAVAAVLRRTSIQDLDLRNNSVGAVGARALAEGLRSSSVTSLNLLLNSLGDEGASALAGVLKECPLRSLVLWGISNRIGVAGAQALAESLPSSSLTTLDLRANCLQDAGVIALAGALPQSSIEVLELSFTGFGSPGMLALAAAMKETVVATLGVAGNDIGLEGAQALLTGLRDSPVIEMPHLEKCSVDNETRQEIRAILLANKARSFVLTMEAQKSKDEEMDLKFRTIGGTVAAVLSWSLDKPAQDMPKAVVSSMRSSGSPLPFKGLSAVNLKLVRPDGAVLAVGPTAAPLAQQLGLSTEPSSSTRPSETGPDTAGPSKKPRAE